jgi:hypothetical protein
MQAEREIKADPKNLTGLQQHFCLSAAPVIWSNHWREKDDSNQPQAADWARVLQGSDACIPLPWFEKPRLLAFSKGGYTDKLWELPAAWRDMKSASLSRIAPDGRSVTPLDPVEIKEGKLKLSLHPGEAVMITP